MKLVCSNKPPSPWQQGEGKKKEKYDYRKVNKKGAT